MVGRLGDYDIDTVTLPGDVIEWRGTCFRCDFEAQTSRSGPLITYYDVYSKIMAHVCDPAKKNKVGPITA